MLDPLGSNRANVDGTVHVLIAAKDAKVKRVVYAASSSAYGDTPSLPKHEGMPPNPISPYAVAKLASEYYMTSFYRCYGLETVSLQSGDVPGTLAAMRRWLRLLDMAITPAMLRRAFHGVPRSACRA